MSVCFYLLLNVCFYTHSNAIILAQRPSNLCLAASQIKYVLWTHFESINFVCLNSDTNGSSSGADVNDTWADNDFCALRKREIGALCLETVWYIDRNTDMKATCIFSTDICPSFLFALPRSSVCDSITRNCVYFSFSVTSICLMMSNKRRLNLLYVNLLHRFTFFLAHKFGVPRLYCFFLLLFFREFMDYLLCFNCCLYFWCYDVVSTHSCHC